VNSELTNPAINTQMVESLVQLICSLPVAERTLLETRLSETLPELSTPDLMQLCDRGGSFDFWHQEPDSYTLEDGTPIEW
jgi:hypothetical protein